MKSKRAWSGDCNSFSVHLDDERRSAMKLLFLGTTGYHPNNRRHTVCLMLPEIGVVLDAGSGMFRVREHLETSTLDIFLSHAHLDHVMGLTFLFDVLHETDIQKACVHGTKEKLKAVDEQLFSEHLFPVKPPIEYRPLEGDIELSDGSRLRYFPVRHPGGAIGYRIDWPGRSLGFVTDTTADPEADYVKHIQNVDVLVHECYFPDGCEGAAEKTGHSCTSSVARVAKKANAKSLYLIHMNPLDESDDPIGLQSARDIFDRADLAYDGMNVDI